MDEDLIAELIAGTTESEHPADVLFMCTNVVLTEFGMSGWAQIAGKWRPQGAFPMWDAIQDSSFFYRRLRTVGKIMCPIFTIIKPREYVKRMIDTRLAYSGVAANLEIQQQFLKRVHYLLQEGQFRSVEQAVENELWRQLSPDAPLDDQT